MYSERPNTGHSNTGHIRKPDKFVSGFQMATPFENRTGFQMVKKFQLSWTVLYKKGHKNNFLYNKTVQLSDFFVRSGFQMVVLPFEIRTKWSGFRMVFVYRTI